MVARSPGSTFHGRYEIVRCIKAGGMGAIYEVIHLETQRRRALKLMLPSVLASVDMRERFKLEATIAAGIESEHIVETFDAGVDEETGAPFLVMELLRGEDLATIVGRRGRLSPDAVVRLLSQTASAIDKTHAAGVIHRDLKPDNLFVTRRDDGAPKVKILDFGIAKVVSESGQSAAKTKVLGTPLYMSPEQVRGDGRIGPRADLYALAQIAFTLLVGKAYWAEEHDALPVYALLTRIIGGCQVPAPERAARYGGATTPAFGAWFGRATHVLPEERFASAAEMVATLAEALGVAAPPASSPAFQTDPRLGAPGLSERSTVAYPDAPTGATKSLRPEDGLPAEPHRTATEAPAALVTAESPRRSLAGTRIAGVAAAAAVVLAAVALTSRPAGPAGAVPAASEGGAVPVPSASVSAQTASVDDGGLASPKPSVDDGGLASAPPRRPGPAAARPLTKPPVTPAGTPARPPAPASTSESDARPVRSLD